MCIVLPFVIKIIFFGQFSIDISNLNNCKRPGHFFSSHLELFYLNRDLYFNPGFPFLFKDLPANQTKYNTPFHQMLCYALNEEQLGYFTKLHHLLRSQEVEVSKAFFGAKSAVYIQTLQLSKNCDVILLHQQCL